MALDGTSLQFDARDFGAKGDGVNDDTAEIQAAIDAAYAAGGGTVVLGAGTFIVSGTSDKSDGAIRLLDNVTLQGAGIGVTILKVEDDSAYNITGVVRTPFNEITHDVALYDVTIDGNRANNTTKIDGFYSGVAPDDTRQDYNITVERVEIMNMSGYGFDPHEQTVNLRIADSIAHHNGLDGFVADYIVGGVFENNVAYANDRHGFNVTTSSEDLLLLNNQAYANGSAGLIVQRGSEDIPAPDGVTIEGGEYYNNTREGIYIKIAENVSITGVDVHDNQRQGIRLDGVENALIDGVTSANNSQAGTGIYDEIRINRYDDTAGASGQIFDSTGVVVQNSTILSDGAIRSRYGVAEALDVTGHNTQSGNTISGTSAAATFFAPQLLTPAQDQIATANAGFSYRVAPNSFFDADHPMLKLSATLANGAPLPSWLGFDPVTGQFSGTPNASASYQIVVRATDAQGLSATTGFNLVATSSTVGEIVGTGDAETLVGSAGPENIYGLAGNDILVGGGGPDRLDGGDGVDLGSYAASPIGVVVDLQAGTGSGGDAQGDTLVAIENLGGSTFADQLAGDAGVNELRGGAGNDVLRGRGGADVLDGGTDADQLEGGDGDDLYFVDTAGDVVFELDNGGLGGTDTVRSTASYTLAANVEHLTLLGSADIDATGNGKNNILVGNAGANVLDGGAGNDTMEGGLGNDTYLVNTSQDLVIELAEGGTDTVRSTITRTLEAQVENLTLLGTAAVNATGNALANVLTGNGGANLLTGNEGDDTLLGGGGNDTLRGGLGADTLDGGAGADRMEGGDGNDLYHVDDAGDLVVEFANGGLGGVDTVRSTISLALGTNVENLTLTGASDIDATGNGQGNVLVGNDGANVLDGGAGNDTMEGGRGNDTYIVTTSGDAVIELADGGTDTIRSTITRTLEANVENLTLLGEAAINATGNGLANVLTGNGSANLLTGNDGDDLILAGAGNDTLRGGLGDDTLYGEAGADRMEGGDGNDTYFVDEADSPIIEVAGQGYDTVAAGFAYALPGGASIELMTTGFIGGTTAVNLTGNEIDNQIWGNDGSNVLDGGGGNDALIGFGGDDTMYGGAGNDVLFGLTGADAAYGGSGDDTIFLDQAGDSVFEAADEGQDTVAAGFSYTLAAGAHVELITTGFIGGTAAIDLGGNEFGNEIWGNAAGNVLNGGGGNDALVGFGGDDTLIGGTGADALIGNTGDDTYRLDNSGDVAVETAGEGSDSFVFLAAPGSGTADKIIGFAPGADRIALDDAAFAGLASGTLAASAFVTGTAAADADDRIIYNATTGALSFDADGTGAGAAHQFAVLDPGLALAASDFLVI